MSIQKNPKSPSRNRKINRHGLRKSRLINRKGSKRKKSPLRSHHGLRKSRLINRKGSKRKKSPLRSRYGSLRKKSSLLRSQICDGGNICLQCNKSKANDYKIICMECNDSNKKKEYHNIRKNSELKMKNAIVSLKNKYLFEIGVKNYISRVSLKQIIKYEELIIENLIMKGKNFDVFYESFIKDFDFIFSLYKEFRGDDDDDEIIEYIVGLLKRDRYSKYPTADKMKKNIARILGTFEVIFLIEKNIEGFYNNNNYCKTITDLKLPVINIYIDETNFDEYKDKNVQVNKTYLQLFNDEYVEFNSKSIDEKFSSFTSNDVFIKNKIYKFESKTYEKVIIKQSLYVFANETLKTDSDKLVLSEFICNTSASDGYTFFYNSKNNYYGRNGGYISFSFPETRNGFATHEVYVPGGCLICGKQDTVTGPRGNKPKLCVTCYYIYDCEKNGKKYLNDIKIEKQDEYLICTNNYNFNKSTVYFNYYNAQTMINISCPYGEQNIDIICSKSCPLCDNKNCDSKENNRPYNTHPECIVKYIYEGNWGIFNNPIALKDNFIKIYTETPLCIKTFKIIYEINTNAGNYDCWCGGRHSVSNKLAFLTYIYTDTSGYLNVVNFNQREHSIFNSGEHSKLEYNSGNFKPKMYEKRIKEFIRNSNEWMSNSFGEKNENTIKNFLLQHYTDYINERAENYGLLHYFNQIKIGLDREYFKINDVLRRLRISSVPTVGIINNILTFCKLNKIKINMVDKKVDKNECQVCYDLTSNGLLCDEERHIIHPLCPNCFKKILNRKCPTCKRPFTNLHHPPIHPEPTIQYIWKLILKKNHILKVETETDDESDAIFIYKDTIFLNYITKKHEYKYVIYIGSISTPTPEKDGYEQIIYKQNKDDWDTINNRDYDDNLIIFVKESDLIKGKKVKESDLIKGKKDEESDLVKGKKDEERCLIS